MKTENNIIWEWIIDLRKYAFPLYELQVASRLKLKAGWHHRSVTIATMEVQTGMLSSLAECYLGDVTLKSVWRHNCCGNKSMV